MRWHAHTYLVRFSLRAPPALTAVAGLSWGYDLVAGHPTTLAPDAATTADWDADTTATNSLNGWELASELNR